jgi:hypothetical protein
MQDSDLDGFRGLDPGGGQRSGTDEERDPPGRSFADLHR